MRMLSVRTRGVGCAAPPRRCWRCLGHLLPCRLEVAIGHLSRLTHPEHAAVALMVRAALPGCQYSWGP